MAHNPSKSSLGLVFSKCGNTPAGVEIPGWFSVGHCERLDGRINQIFPARYTSIYLYLLVFCIYPNTVIICIYTHREISIVFFTTSAIYIYIYISITSEYLISKLYPKYMLNIQNISSISYIVFM